MQHIMQLWDITTPGRAALNIPILLIDPAVPGFCGEGFRARGRAPIDHAA